jgi:uncharacterized protein (DUF433 family)
MDDLTEKKVAELAAATAALPSADPVTRACAARELIEWAKDTYSRVRQDSIAEALAAGRTYEELADELGVSAAAINAAVTARNARRGAGSIVLTPHKGGRPKELRGAAGRIIDELVKSGNLRLQILSEDALGAGFPTGPDSERA